MTPELIALFPDRKHFLFELNPIFKESIIQNYAKIDYQLFFVGLSDVNSTLFLIGKSLMKDGQVTHNQISSSKVDVDGKEIVQCEKCQVKRFDNMKIDVLEGSLLKVDIDGQDIKVINGIGELMPNFSVIIIESTADKLGDTIKTISSHGFMLYDIVDIIYYGPSLYQCDVVFVNRRYITKELKPDIKNFNKSLWKQACKAR